MNKIRERINESIDVYFNKEDEEIYKRRIEEGEITIKELFSEAFTLGYIESKVDSGEDEMKKLGFHR